MSITLSPHEIIALLLEADKNDTPTDALTTARQKLVSEYRRTCGATPMLEQFRDNSDRQEIRDINEYQQSLLDGYYAADPGTRLLGYFKGQPVMQAHTVPLRMRSDSSRRQIVVVTRDGAPKMLPLTGWADNFIPAEGVTWAECETAIADWHTHNQDRLVRKVG